MEVRGPIEACMPWASTIRDARRFRGWKSAAPLKLRHPRRGEARWRMEVLKRRPGFAR